MFYSRILEASNISLALFFAALYHGFRVSPDSLVAILLRAGALMNLVLAVFNAIPLPPLDGSRIMMSVLPTALLPAYRKLESFGFLLVLILWMTNFLDKLLLPIIDLFTRLLGLF